MVGWQSMSPFLEFEWVCDFFDQEVNDDVWLPRLCHKSHVASSFFTQTFSPAALNHHEKSVIALRHYMNLVCYEQAQATWERTPVRAPVLF